MNSNHQYSKKSTLSVVMIVKDEGKHLDGCLTSISGLADEIIILDSGSNDETEQIAKRHKAKFYVNTKWEGFGKQRQLAQSYALCDYVLAIDADERLDKRLQQSITEVLGMPVNHQYSFAMMRQNIYYGKVIHKMGYRTRLNRLYAKDAFSFCDATVHESLNCDRSKSIVLKGNLHHQVCNNIHHLIQKNLRYSSDWAIEKHQSSKKGRFFDLFSRSIASFVREYFLRGSFLAGGLGLIIACINASYTFNKYVILYDLRKKDSSSSTR